MISHRYSHDQSQSQSQWHSSCGSPRGAAPPPWPRSLGPGGGRARSRTPTASRVRSTPPWGPGKRPRTAPGVRATHAGKYF
eukprot:8598548-Pyramimonas_sp.AAC.1